MKLVSLEREIQFWLVGLVIILLWAILFHAQFYGALWIWAGINSWIFLGRCQKEYEARVPEEKLTVYDFAFDKRLERVFDGERIYKGIELEYYCLAWRTPFIMILSIVLGFYSEIVLGRYLAS